MGVAVSYERGTPVRVVVSASPCVTGMGFPAKEGAAREGLDATPLAARINGSRI